MLQRAREDNHQIHLLASPSPQGEGQMRQNCRTARVAPLVVLVLSKRSDVKSPHLWRVAFMSLTALVGGAIVAFTELSLIWGVAVICVVWTACLAAVWLSDGP
jgi:hypothetical protein